MIKSDRDEPKVLALTAAVAPSERLPYRIELWDLQRTAMERVLGRAASAPLARAIFTAAQTEHLGRYIVLRRGARVIAESA